MTNCNPDAEVIEMVNNAPARRQRAYENKALLHEMHIRKQEQDRIRRMGRIALHGVTECGGYAIIGGAALAIALQRGVSPEAPLLICFGALFLAGWRARDYARAVMSA